MGNEILTKIGEKAEWASSGGSVPKPLTYDYMPEGYPTKSGWSIEWDGNTEGLISAGVFYKVSDMVPTDDELIGAILWSSTGIESKLTSDMITAISEDITAILDGEGGLIVRKDNAIFDDNTVLPQKGIYSMKYQDTFTSKLSKQNITPMAEEFLPDTAANKEYVDAKFADGIIIPSSTPDSTKRFKITVDDSGTISATEVTT